MYFKAHANPTDKKCDHSHLLIIFLLWEIWLWCPMVPRKHCKAFDVNEKNSEGQGCGKHF